MEMVKANKGIGIGGAIGIFFITICTMFASGFMLVFNEIIGKELAMLICYVASMGGTFIFVHYMFGSDGYKLKSENIKVLLLLVCTTIAIQTGVSGPIINLIPMSESIKNLFMELLGDTDIYSFLMMVIAAPILEELIFRGIVLNGLLKRYSPKKAIIVSAIIFGLVHLNPWQFVSASMIGFLMGWVYYKTHNILLTIVIHMANNLVGFLLFLVVDPSEMMDTSVFELYGGILNYIFIIIGAIAIGGFCLKLLYNEFEKRAPIKEFIDTNEVNELA